MAETFTIDYVGKRQPNVLIIGSGAGAEVLDALHYASLEELREIVSADCGSPVSLDCQVASATIETGFESCGRDGSTVADAPWWRIYIATAR